MASLRSGSARDEWKKRMYNHLRASPPSRGLNALSLAYWRGYDNPDLPCPARLAIRGSQVNQAWRAGRDAARAAIRRAEGEST